MANHKSAQKRIRSSASRNERNHYQAKTARNAMKQLRNSTSKAEAGKLYQQVASMLDKLAKKNIIHSNKAANLKSGLSRHVASLK